MNGKTHVIGGMAAAVGVAHATGSNVVEAAVMVGGALLTAKLPDLDRILDDGPNHRSLTHSVVLAGGGVLVAALILSTLFPGRLEGDSTLGVALWFGMAAGYLSHLLLDSLTPKRVPLLGLGGRCVGLGLVRTGSSAETGFAVLLVAAFVIGAITLVTPQPDQAVVTMLAGCFLLANLKPLPDPSSALMPRTPTREEQK